MSFLRIFSVLILALHANIGIADRVSANNILVKLDPVAKNMDGSVRYMSHASAKKYCQKRGGLPTVLDFILAFHMECAGPDCQTVAPENEPEIRYSREKFRRHPGSEGDEWFWTSTIELTGESVEERREPFDLVFAFVSYNGQFLGDASYAGNAVRCLSK